MKLRIFVGMTMATWLWAQPGPDGAEAPGRVGRLSFVYGAVSYRPDAVEEWAPAALNLPLSTGDHLWTGRDAQAEVQVGLTVVHLAPETGFLIRLLDDRTFRMGLAEGALNIRIPRMNEGELVEVETPYGLFRLLAAGSYRVDVQPEGDYAAVIVRAGAAQAVANGQTHDVPAGRRLVLAGKPAVVELMDAPPMDAWDEWCAARDEQAERGYDRSSQYVTWEISGAADFADYGDWESVPDYGWCWIPRYLPAGWAPYRFGFWIWKKPWGWTWVDHAPWGFATHHFGRWVRTPRKGWLWRPDNDRFHPRFAGAHVEFSRRDGRVSWAPLGNRGAATTVSERDFVTARDVGRARVEAIGHGEFTRTVAVAPTRESMLGGRPSGGPALRRNAQPVATAPADVQARDDAPRREILQDGGARRPGDNNRRGEEARTLDETRRAEEARRAEESRRADEQRRQADEARRRDEDNRRAEEARRGEESRRDEHRRQADDTRRRDEDNRRAEEARRAEESRRADEHRREADEARRRDEDNRRAEEARRAEESRRADEQRRQADEARRQEEQRNNMPRRK